MLRLPLRRERPHQLFIEVSRHGDHEDEAVLRRGLKWGRLAPGPRGPGEKKFSSPTATSSSSDQFRFMYPKTMVFEPSSFAIQPSYAGETFCPVLVGQLCLHWLRPAQHDRSKHTNREPRPRPFEGVESSTTFRNDETERDSPITWSFGPRSRRSRRIAISSSNCSCVIERRMPEVNEHVRHRAVP